MNLNFRTLLKEFTKPYHEELNKSDYANKLMNGSLSWIEYKNYLVMFYFIHKQLEPMFCSFSDWETYNINISERCKLFLLEKDLTQMGIEFSKLATKFKIANPESFAEAIGMLYVLEGSTNGSKILSKKVELLFQEKVKCNYYFSGYAENTDRMWNEFCQFLESYSIQNPEQKKDILNGARNGFIMVKNAFAFIATD